MHSNRVSGPRESLARSRDTRAPPFSPLSFLFPPSAPLFRSKPFSAVRCTSHTYPRLVLAWIHVMRGLGRFELSVLMSSELAASSDVIKVFGSQRLKLRMFPCSAQPRAQPPQGVGRRGVSACFTLQRSVTPSLTSYIPSTPYLLLRRGASNGAWGVKYEPAKRG